MVEPIILSRCSFCNNKEPRLVRLPRSSLFVDLTQKVFSRLTVQHFLGIAHHGGYWCCKCICGEYAIVLGGNLRKGHTQSCGCWLKQWNKTRSTTHGMYKSPTYLSWTGMIGRCTNPNNSEYHRYGARGIIICDQWRSSFLAFYNDMGERPTGASLDRKDNALGYTPDNCRWATTQEQANNRRSNHILALGDEEHTITEWSKITGFSVSCLRRRLKHGLSVKETLTLPSQRGINKRDRS